MPVLRGRTLNTPKPAQLNAVAAGQRIPHAFEDGFHRQLSLSLGDAGFWLPLR